MEFSLSLMIFLTFFINVSHCAVVLKPISSIYLPYGFEADNTTGLYGVDKDALEQSAYDEATGIVYAAGNSYIHIVDFGDATNPVILKSVPITGLGVLNDIEMCGERVAFAAQGLTDNDPGQIHVYNLYDEDTGNFTMNGEPLIVGYTPDMLHFTKDCNTIVVVNEASGYSHMSATGSAIVDQEAIVTIIQFGDGSQPPLLSSVDFTHFNARANYYIQNGVRWSYRGELGTARNTFSQNLEPEYVTFNEDETKAYICLQENNAIAVLDMRTMYITELYPLGAKSWKDLKLDGSDKDSGINLQSYDIDSFRQPDSIYHFVFKGVGYIVTGNEGETIEYKSGVQKWSDTKRGRKLVEDGLLASDVNQDVRDALADDSRLGRLEFSIVDGLSTSEPTKISRPHFHGGRGISIFRASDMSLVWDSGDMISKMHAELYPSTFNGNTKPDDPSTESPETLMDKRADNQGPECETLTIGQLDDGTRLLFVGVARTSSVVVYRFAKDSTEPRLEFESMFRAGGTSDTFDVLLENRNVGNLDPEDLKFIPASESSTGNALLLVTGTTSGTLVMYEVVDDGTSGGDSIHSAFMGAILIVTALIGLFCGNQL